MRDGKISTFLEDLLYRRVIFDTKLEVNSLGNDN